MTRSPKITLILGGAKSGKSSRAVSLARPARDRVYFLATAERSDRELAARIAAHRARRPRSWITIEESRRVPERLSSIPAGSTVLLDCVTMWTARLLSDGMKPAEILAQAERLPEIARRKRLRLIAVSNEVGSGVVPGTRLGRAYQDLLGQVNARLAAAADRVELMVAGLPVALKPARRRG